MGLIPLIKRVPAHITIVQSRAQYLAKYGQEAPPYDWSRPKKTWIDNRVFSDPDLEIEYTGVQLDRNDKPIQDGDTRNVVLRAFKLYPEIATSANLPPEPAPADAEMTPAQRAMFKRRVPEPLELQPGERVVIEPGASSALAVDDGKPDLSAGGSGFTDADRQLLIRVATKLGVR